jgi:hypothetical protein
LHSSTNCKRSSTTAVSFQLTLHFSEIGGKALILYGDYFVTYQIAVPVTTHAGHYPRRGTQECVKYQDILYTQSQDILYTKGAEVLTL